MRIRIIALTLVLSSTLFIHLVHAQTVNALSAKEQEEGWKLLFNGKDVGGWRELTTGGWEVKEGELRAVPSNDPKQKDIITTGTYEYFEFYFEFMTFDMTNSGIKYWVSSDYSERENQYLGLEYQILDDDKFVYPERGIFRSTAALYDLIPALKKPAIALGKWNTARVIVNRGRIQHWLNGTKVLEFDPGTDAFHSLVMQSKYVDLKRFGTVRKGAILLQNEGTPVSFRNLKIRQLLGN